MGEDGGELSKGVSGLDMAGGERLGDQVRLVARVELVAEIFNMAFDRPRGDPELLRALLGREAGRNALQDLALALGQGNELFLLLRKIHHAPLVWETFSCLSTYKLGYAGITEG